MPDVLVPYTEMVEDAEHLGLSVQLYDGSKESRPNVEDVEFYVLPYMGGDDTTSLIDSMPNVKFVQALTAGYDNVLPHLRKGVVLCNGRGVHDASTAELAVCLMLHRLTGMPAFDDAHRDHRWDPHVRDTIADTTVLVVGYGSVGRAIGARLAGFECEVIGMAREARPEYGVRAIAEAPMVVPKCDIVVVSVPLTKQTDHLIDRDFIALMKPHALLVNVSRGRVVDSDALADALGAGRITAAIDVADPEPLPSNHALWSAPGLTITPHVGGRTNGFRHRARKLVAAQLTAFAQGAPLSNIITARSVVSV